MKSEKTRGLADAALKARARLIWSSSDGKQRRGYFLAGVGLETGKRLDAVAHEANALLLDANGAISSGENARAVAAISALAEKLFDIPPFVPEPCPVNWREILALWLAGAPIANVGGSADISDVLRFVENGLVYKLPWGMDAIRVRAEANEDDMGLGTTIDSYEVGWAVPAVETGTLNRSAALLIQAGFTSRLAAIKAAEDTSAAFLNTEDLTEWLQSEEVVSLSQRAEWPTRETAGLWRSFLDSYTPSRRSVWSKRSAVRHVRWRHGVTPPPAGSIVRIRNLHSETVVMSPTYDVMGTFAVPIRRTWAGVLLARVGVESGTVNATYYGPKDIRLN